MQIRYSHWPNVFISLADNLHPHRHVSPERMYAFTYSLFLNIHVVVPSYYATPQTQGHISCLCSRFAFIQHSLPVELFYTIKREHWNDWIFPSHCCSAWYRTDSFLRCVCVCVCVCRSQGEVRIGPLTVSADSSTNRASLRGDLIRAGGCTSGRVHNKWPTVPRAPVAYEIKRTFITLSVIPLCPRSPFLSQSASSGGRRGSHHYL